MAAKLDFFSRCYIIVINNDSITTIYAMPQPLIGGVTDNMRIIL